MGGVYIYTYYNTRPWSWEECTFPLRSILKPLSFFFLSLCSWINDRQLCSSKWDGERRFALDFFLCFFFWGGGVGVESVSWWKDWICNKIEHCDVGMVFHSTLESRCHLKEEEHIGLGLIQPQMSTWCRKINIWRHNGESRGRIWAAPYAVQEEVISSQVQLLTRWTLVRFWEISWLGTTQLTSGS